MSFVAFLDFCFIRAKYTEEPVWLSTFKSNVFLESFLILVLPVATLAFEGSLMFVL